MASSLAEKPLPDQWGEMTSEAIQAICLVGAPRNAVYRHPLFRRAYLVCFVLVSLCFLVPCWVVLYLPRSRRPRPSWSLSRCLRVRWSRRLCSVVAKCEVDYLGRDLSVDMDPMRLIDSHPVTIPAAPIGMLRGYPAKALGQLQASRGKWNPHFVHRADRQPGGWGRWNAESDRQYGFEDVKAFWYTGRKNKPEDGEPPGATAGSTGDPALSWWRLYLWDGAEIDLTSAIAKSLAVHSPVRHILSVDYRLAPTAPWPLPLLDAISSYVWLATTEQIPERDIILVGDSAGGHLVLALARWLRDEGPSLGFKGPRAIVLLSPWTDVGFTNVWGAENIRYNAESDTIDDTFGPFATSLLLRALPPDSMHTSAYLSPASLLIAPQATGPDSFAGFPPTYVAYGGAERLSRSIRIFWSRLQLARQAGSMDRLVEGPDAVHDFCIFPWMAKEAGDVYEDLDVWLRELLSTEDEPTPEETASPDWKQIAFQRQHSRVSFHGKSPVMGPMTENGVIRMVEDMRSEGMSMIDMPDLDLDASWGTHLTTHFEQEEGEDMRPWYEPGLDSEDDLPLRGDRKHR